MRVLVYGFSGKIIGGIETFILNMNDHMSDECIFDYMIDGKECVYQDRITHKGGKVFFVTPVRRNSFRYIHDVWKTFGDCKEQGTNVLYVQLFSMSNSLPLWLAKMRGFKVILHAHNNGLQTKSKVYTIIHLLGKCFTSLGRFLRLTNSRLSSDFMFGKSKKSELIYNAIDVDKFKFDVATRDYLRTAESCGNKLVVGFVGRLVPPKNPLFVLHIFAALAKKHRDAMLWIVGEGDLRGDMKQLAEELGISEQINWLGKRDDVNKLMSAMDILLQPSLFEGLGIVLVEAQAAGLPCITSADVVPEEVNITDGITRVSLNASPDNWADACMYALGSIRNDKRTEAYIGIANSGFNIKKEAPRLEEILRDANGR